MNLYVSGMSSVMSVACAVSCGNLCNNFSLWRLSITKIISAQIIIFAVTTILADRSVPADFTNNPGLFLKIVSAVKLRHLFRLQTKSNFFKRSIFYCRRFRQRLRIAILVSIVNLIQITNRIYRQCKNHNGSMTNKITNTIYIGNKYNFNPDQSDSATRINDFWVDALEFSL